MSFFISLLPAIVLIVGLGICIYISAAVTDYENGIIPY